MRQITKRKIFWLAAIIIITIFAVFTYVNSTSFSTQFKKILTKNISDVIGEQVEISSIKTDLFRSLLINDLRIKSTLGKELLSVKKIKVVISIPKLIKNRKNISSIVQQINLYNPNIKIVKNSSGKFTVNGLEKLMSKSAPGSNSKLPPWKINIVNAEITLDIDADRIYRFTNIDSKSFLGGYPNILTEIKFKYDNVIQNINLKAAIHVVKQNFELDVNFKNMDLGQLKALAIFPDHMLPESGRLNSRLKLTGFLQELKKTHPDIAVTGTVDIRDMKYKDYYASSLKLDIYPDSIAVRNSHISWLKNSFIISGKVEEYLLAPRLDFQLDGSISSQETLKSYGINFLKGETQIKAKLTGQISDLKAEGSLNLKTGMFYYLPINDLSTSFLFQDATLEFNEGTADLDGAKLLWHGSINQFKNLNMTFKMSDFQLSDITLYPAIKAKLSGDLFLLGTIEDPKIKSDLRLEKLIIPGRHFEHITMRAAYASNILKMNAFTLNGDYSLKAEIKNIRSSNTFLFEKFSIQGPLSESINLSGFIKYNPLLISLDVNAKSVAANDVPYLKKIYSNALGTSDFSGHIQYKNDEILIDSKVQTGELTINNNEYYLACDASLKHNKKNTSINITNLNLNNYLYGELDLFLNAEHFSIQRSSIIFQRASLKDIMSLSGASLGVETGEITGLFEVVEDVGKFDLTISTCNIKQYNLGNINSVILYDKGSLELKDFVSNVEDGNMFISGKVLPTQDILIEFNDYPLGLASLRGFLKYRAKKAEIYKFDIASKLEINREVLSEIIVEGNDGPEGFEMKFHNNDMSLKGEFEYPDVEPRSFEAELWLKKLELNNIVGLIKGGVPITGETNGNIKLMGTAQAPILYTDISVVKGNYADSIPFDFDIEAEYNSGAYTIDAFKGNLGREAYFDLIAAISKDGILSSTATINNLNFSDIAFFTKTDKIHGKFDLTTHVLGNIKDPVTSIVFESQKTSYDGFEFTNISSDLLLNMNSLKLNNLNLHHKGGIIRLQDASILLPLEESFKFDLHSIVENISIGPFSIFGETLLEADIVKNPFALKLKIQPLGNMLINKFALKDTLKIVYGGNSLDISSDKGLEASLFFQDNILNVNNFQIKNSNYLFEAEGNYGPTKYNAVVNAENIEINNFLKLMDKDTEFTGSANLELILEGDSEYMDINGHIDINDAVYNKLSIQNISSEFSYNRGQLQLINTNFKHPKFLDLNLSGKFGKENNLKIVVKRFSLAALEDLSDEIRKGSGYMTGEFQISGDFENPDIKGKAVLEGGNLWGNKVFDKISGISCTIEGNGSRLILRDFAADWSPGKLSINGEIFPFKTPMSLALNIDTLGEKGIAVKIPYLDIPQSRLFGRYLTLPSHGEPVLKLKFFSDKEMYYLKGDVVLKNTNFTYPPTKKRKKKKSSGSSYPTNLVLDINLIAGESVWYQNTYARIKVNGKLHLLQYPSKPIVINGKIFSDQGNLTYFNRDYSLKEANLVFQNTVEYLDARAVTEIQRKTEEGFWEDDEIEIRVPSNRVSKAIPQFSSNRFASDTSSDQAMALTISKVDIEELSQEERNQLLRREFLRAIDATLASPLIKNILEKTDFVDVAKFDVKLSEDLEPDQNVSIEGAGLGIGKYVNDRLYMGYYMELGSLENKLNLFHELDMFYRVQGSQFLKGKISEKEKFFLGIEQQIKF